MNNPIITVNDLNLWYGQTQALKHISLEIPEKSITALIGPSGCGKSTFLKTLNRMNDLIPGVRITGEVAYHGENIFETEAQLDEIVEKALKGAAIWDEVKDRLKKNALGMSGGQQQRLCIARALAVEPEVLLMDEPTSALDPISTSRIEDLAMELKEKYTIVIVTHNMQQAVRISDQTAFFLLGDLVEYGSTETLFSTPSDKRTEDYITGRFG